MTRRSWVFGGGAVVTATAAVGIGVLVTSGAMAASDGGESAATVSMITIGTDGEAYECTVDASVLPVLPADAGATTGVTGVTGTMPVAGGGTVTWSAPGSLPALDAVPIDPASGLPMADLAPMGEGIIVGQRVGGDTEAMAIAADGSMTPVEVRQGTAEECAAATLPPAPPADGG